MPATHETDPPPHVKTVVRVLFVFRDSPATREALEARAAREQTTVSDILRRALAAYLNKP